MTSLIAILFVSLFESPPQNIRLITTLPASKRLPRYRTPRQQLFGELFQYLGRQDTWQAGQSVGICEANRRRGSRVRLVGASCGVHVGRDDENDRHEGPLHFRTVSIQGSNANIFFGAVCFSALPGECLQPLALSILLVAACTCIFFFFFSGVPKGTIFEL